MAKLITTHDPYHVHKTLGLLVLLHYLYRFYLILITGTAFPSNESTSLQLCGVLLHGLLSGSSLLLPLPKQRNFSKPMIWPEFRLHSILFATRQVASTMISLANLWPSSIIYNCIARATIILGTVKLASLITEKFGDRQQRTTNAMPYPANVTPGQQLSIKKMYTAAQFGATVTSLLNDPSMNFAPLLGIQMAALLMTLVRKGKISTTNYHRIYATCLSLGYGMVFVRLLDSVEYAGGVDGTLGALVMYNLPFKRSRRFVSARSFWTVTIVVATIVYPLLLVRQGEDGEQGTIMEGLVSGNSLKKMIWLGLVRTLVNQTITYAPLFAGTPITTIMKKQVDDSDNLSWSYSMNNMLRELHIV